MQDIIQSFIDSMIKDGVVPARPSEIKASGQDEIATLEGDKKPGRIGYCLTTYPDGFAHGNYISFKTGLKGKWISTQNNKKLTKEEKDAFAARMRQADKDRQSRIESGHAAAAKKAKEKWEASVPCESHPYLTKKGVQPNGLRLSGKELVIPLYNNQEIATYETIDEDGVKLYQSGGKKSGSFYVFGDETDTILIGEGWASAASVYEATGFYTFAAMDAHNILSVAQDVRKTFPEALIIICADNDQFRVDSKGKLENIGVIKAQEAAAKIGGFEVHPEFPDDDIELRTDYNDLHQSEGLEAVAKSIMKIVDAQPKKEKFVYDPGTPTFTENGDVDLTCDMGMPFKILGHDKGLTYYFPFGRQQIFAWTPSQHTMSNFLLLADIQDWKDWAKRISDEAMTVKEIPLYALNEMERIAVSRGVFSEGSRVRGCGAWIDADRIILHCGDKLIVNGVETNPVTMESRYVYVSAAPLLKNMTTALANKEAQELRTICDMMHWENPLSGLLLAGWLVIAPVCAMLKWRPHLWIIGEPGSGKSTIVDDIVRPVLGDIAYNVDGGTTESAIRLNLGYDARPVIYDEAGEGANKTESLMDGVIALAKLSSKGGVITKRGQQTYIAQSSFCFSSVDAPVKDFASETRISILSLKKNTSRNATEEFKKIKSKINKTLTRDFGRKMLARTMQNMPTLLKNIQTIRDVASAIINDARAADQISPLIAGLYLLGSAGLITEKEAADWISERDWTDHTSVSAESDQKRCLHHIATSIVNVKGTSGSKDCTIGSLIHDSLDGDDTAKRILRNYSILAKGESVFFGYKNQNLQRLLNGTNWRTTWCKTLGRLPGAVSVSNQYFNAGDTQRSMRIPASFFTEKNRQSVIEFEEEEIDL